MFTYKILDLYLICIPSLSYLGSVITTSNSYYYLYLTKTRFSSVSILDNLPLSVLKEGTFFKTSYMTFLGVSVVKSSSGWYQLTI